MMSKIVISFSIVVAALSISPVDTRNPWQPTVANPQLSTPLPSILPGVKEESAQGPQSLSLSAKSLQALQSATSSDYGDFNGDGLQDFVVGDPLAITFNQTFNGEVKVVYGHSGYISDAPVTALKPGKCDKSFLFRDSSHR